MQHFNKNQRNIFKKKHEHSGVLFQENTACGFIKKTKKTVLYFSFILYFLNY